MGGDDLDTGTVPDIRRSRVRYAGDERLAEGAYYEIGRRHAHYALDDATGPLCGDLPGTKLYRRASSWSYVPESDRCGACDALVGDRRDLRTGWVERGDPRFGLADRSDREFYRQEMVLHRLRPWRKPPARVKGGSFPDPPFVLMEDPKINRLRVGDENRVRNDVYTKPPSGKKWHRIYDVGLPMRRHEEYGRSFSFPCGNESSEFYPVDGWFYDETVLFVGVPPVPDICKACAQSDAKFGKGFITARERWDR
jgi:hypothetical protein